MANGDLSEHHARLGCDPLCEAFPARRPLPPWSGRRAIPEAALAERWARLLASPPERRKRLAYVHVPFCANHCLFCGFYRGRALPAEVDAYAALPIAELEREAESANVAGAPVHAVYLGGGTPSALPARELHRLLLALRRCLPLAPDCEITVEGRVLGFEPEKIDACLEAGANRFSIGVQTFDTDVRRRQGRRASRAELVAFLGQLRDHDRAVLVVDLLLGLPRQTEAIVREDLATCLDLALDGVDLYALNVFPATPLAAAVASGRSEPAASLAERAALYGLGARVLADAGWRQISNSHWARTTRERNLYNLLIKQGADCLAHGAGASGSIGRDAYSLEPDPALYHARVAAGTKPVREIREAGPEQGLWDRVVGGVELGRVDLGGLAPGLRERLAPLVSQWHAARLVEDSGPVLRLTTAGRFWGTNLARGLLAALGLLADGSGTPPGQASRAAISSTTRRTA
jgi:oxygen-independent coproporphyrinogen-3 oxidase